jgi:hypothetical protein
MNWTLSTNKIKRAAKQLLLKELSVKPKWVVDTVARLCKPMRTVVGHIKMIL